MTAGAHIASVYKRSTSEGLVCGGRSLSLVGDYDSQTMLASRRIPNNTIMTGVRCASSQTESVVAYRPSQGGGFGDGSRSSISKGSLRKYREVEDRKKNV